MFPVLRGTTFILLAYIACLVHANFYRKSRNQIFFFAGLFIFIGIARAMTHMTVKLSKNKVCVVIFLTANFGDQGTKGFRELLVNCINCIVSVKIVYRGNGNPDQRIHRLEV